METLPPEVVQVFSRYLRPRDLAFCCAVSPSWREIFDQDCLWKPHCDSTLEESLRTIPSIVEPIFVSPEDENSTLPMLSKWRLAFMRENHLWKNLKKKTYRTHSPEIHNDTFIYTFPFLSDTLIVNWCLKTIEIWDVSVIPATLVATTDSSVDIGNWRYCRVLGNNMLLVEKPTSFQVFLVDVEKRSIKLEHEIPIENEPQYVDDSGPVDVDGSFLCARAIRTSTLTVFDLGKGKRIVEVPCPVVENSDENVNILGMKNLPTSDNVLVKISDGRKIYFYIFSLKQQLYLPCPIAELPNSPYPYYSAINKHHVAICGMSSLTIIDYFTSEVLLKNEGQRYDEPLAYNNSFIFSELSDDTCQLKIFSDKNKSLITFFEYTFDELGDVELNLANDRFAILFHECEMIAAFDLSNQMPEWIDIGLDVPFNLREQINTSYTRSTSTAGADDEIVVIYYYW